MMDESVIRTTALTRRFGQRNAVDLLDLDVPPGAVYGFLGPNGAGKTTTIRLLLGLLHPTAGTVHLFGTPLSTHRLSLLRRLGALVEAPSAYPHLTGEENLRHSCLLKDVPRRDIARVLGIVRLAADAHRAVKEYSLGMKQRLGLAQALLGQPKLIILDEPTNGLDPAGIQEMRHLLRDMPAAHGITVFLSSHLLNEVEQIATHVGIVCEGRLRFQGSPHELRTRQKTQLRIGVDRPVAAADLLRSQGSDATAQEPSTVVIRPSTPDTAARMNRFLVERGFSVHSLIHEQPTLEELFLDLTKASRS